MVQEATVKNFDFAMLGNVLLEAREAVSSWAAEVEQPPAIVVQAQAIQEQVELVPDSEIDDEIKTITAMCAAAGVSPSEIANIIDDLAKCRGGNSTRSEVKAAIGKARGEADKAMSEASAENTTGRHETPQQAVERIWNEIHDLQKDVTSALDKAHDNKDLSDEEYDKIAERKEQLEALDKSVQQEREEVANMPEGPEKEQRKKLLQEREKELEEKTKEDANRSAEELELAAKRAEARGDHKAAAAYRAEIPKTQEILDKTVKVHDMNEKAQEQQKEVSQEKEALKARAEQIKALEEPGQGDLGNLNATQIQVSQVKKATTSMEMG